MGLVTRIYEVTKRFPADEMYGLTNQLRRAAISIPSNIAEGAARNSRKEFSQFLFISLGSLAEVETQLLIAGNLNYIEDGELLTVEIQCIRKLINGLIFSFRSKVE